MATLIVFVDALPYDDLDHMQRLGSWPWRARLRPGFGYSINLHAEIFAGLTPDDAGFFGEWTIDPEHAPGRRIATLLPALDAVCRPYVVNRGLQQLLTRRYRPDRIMPNLPLARLADFSLLGEKVASPRFPHATLFTRHPQLLSISADGLHKGARDEALARRGRDAIDRGAEQVYIPLLDLDGIGHAHRATGPEWRAHRDRIDAWADELATTFLDRHPEGNAYVVSDHGMADVRGAVAFDIDHELGPPARGRYLYFTDSTLVRVWVSDASLGPDVADYFARSRVARLVTHEERVVHGLTNPAFGDFIAVLDEGICFRPSTFARNIPAAMHGYHPEVPSQHALLLHRGPNPPAMPVRRTLDVFAVLDEALTRG